MEKRNFHHVPPEIVYMVFGCNTPNKSVIHILLQHCVDWYSSKYQQLIIHMDECAMCMAIYPSNIVHSRRILALCVLSIFNLSLPSEIHFRYCWLFATKSLAWKTHRHTSIYEKRHSQKSIVRTHTDTQTHTRAMICLHSLANK